MATQHVFLNDPPRGNTNPENWWFFERNDLLAVSSCHLEQQDWSINKPWKPRRTFECIEVYINRTKRARRNLWRSYGKNRKHKLYTGKSSNWMGTGFHSHRKTYQRLPAKMGQTWHWIKTMVNVTYILCGYQVWYWWDLYHIYIYIYMQIICIYI